MTNGMSHAIEKSGTSTDMDKLSDKFFEMKLLLRNEILEHQSSSADWTSLSTVIHADICLSR
jgi:hypothetical protein